VTSQSALDKQARTEPAEVAPAARAPLAVPPRLRVMFVVPYPTEAPSNRLRIEQYFPYLRRHGIKVRLRPFMSSHFYRIRYRPGAIPSKAFSLAWSTVNRLLDIRRAGQADVIVVHREAFPFGGPFFEQAMARSGAPIVFDFDDAIYLHSSGESNPLMRLLKRPEKTGRIIELSAEVIAGNETLKAYAERFNRGITVIPTPVDTDHFRPKPKRTELDRVVIGWIGSNTTAPYLKMVEPALLELTRRYPRVELRIVGGSYRPSGLENVSLRSWGLESELRELHGFDIGIMPMPDTDWTRGKCGFKGLFYMSVGLPSVCSPVGMTTDFIQDGQNGYLATSTEEWVARLSALIEDVALRRTIGQAGRQTVEEKYSLHAQAPRLLAVIDRAASGRRGVL
jgi:glycosyltransferase involved in cell wall biosynthesis